MTLYVIGTGEYSDATDICLIKDKEAAIKAINKMNDDVYKVTKKYNPNDDWGLEEAKETYWIRPLPVKSYSEMKNYVTRKYNDY